jgi:hypothetical protein
MKKQHVDTPYKGSWADDMAHSSKVTALPEWWGKPMVLIKFASVIGPYKRGLYDSLG